MDDSRRRYMDLYKPQRLQNKPQAPEPKEGPMIPVTPFWPIASWKRWLLKAGISIWLAALVAITVGAAMSVVRECHEHGRFIAGCCHIDKSGEKVCP